MTPEPATYLRYRFPAEVIRHAVWLYHVFSLSLRDVELILAERGITVTHESIRQWCLTFGAEFAHKLRRRRPKPGDTWHLDEVFLKINGELHYLWRAVDQHGVVLDILVQDRRNATAAKRFFKRLLAGLKYKPKRIVTDGLRSYGVAHREVLPEVKHRTSRYLNNRAENSHRPTRRRERQMQRFKSPEQAQHFLSSHAMIYGHFRPRRHLMTAAEYRTARAKAFWIRRKGAPNLAEGIMVFLGIDVSKDRLDCALLATAGVKVLGGRSFPNDAAGIEKIVAWTERVAGVAPAEVHGVLEATAAYHELAAHRLAAAGLRVSIVNSARVRSFGKGLGILGKTDPIDARLLARYGQLASPRAWRAPAKPLTDLEALLARLDDIEGDLRREESRLEQARARSCPAPVEGSLLESIKAAKGRRDELRRVITAHVTACPELRADLDRLLTIPAVGPRTATRMLVLLRTRAFDSARQAAACLGLVPVERTSGKSVRGRPVLSKAGNPRLRAALYMAAIVGVRCNPDLHAQYARLLGRGKCKMSALAAAMRKLVHLCFGVLRNAEDYRPSASKSS